MTIIMASADELKTMPNDEKKIETVIPIPVPPPPYVMKYKQTNKSSKCGGTSVWLLITNLITIAMLFALIIYVVHHRQDLGWSNWNYGGSADTDRPKDRGSNTLIVIDNQNGPPMPDPNADTEGPLLDFWMFTPTSTAVQSSTTGASSTVQQSTTGADSSAAMTTTVAQTTGNSGTGPTGGTVVVVPVIMLPDSNNTLANGLPMIQIEPPADPTGSSTAQSSPAPTTESGSSTAGQTTTSSDGTSTDQTDQGQPPAIQPDMIIVPLDPSLQGSDVNPPPTVSATTSSSSGAAQCDGMQCGCYQNKCWTWATQDPNSNWFCYTQTVDVIMSSDTTSFAQCSLDTDCTPKMMCADCMIYDEVDGKQPRRIC